ncbi:peroxiredoxin Q [Lactifluus subvellereus]|nr:peroxiredoxin Q [Lactifluus subvellereus]
MSSKHSLLGQPAPALSLPDADGSTYELKPGGQGKPMAIFFYPKAGTFGCTREVCGFRDALTEKVEFKDSGITVIGISPDPVPAIKAFATKHNVTYPMLSDESGEARKAYSISRRMMGLSEGRVTFFVDSEGVVRDVFDSVINFNGHISAISKALEVYNSQGKPTDAAAAAAEPTTTTND